MKRVRFFFAAIICTLLLGASAAAQSVVVNKYFNSGGASGVGDVVELLVIQDGLDMRGMILKDFSSSMANDGGGKYQFSTDTLWASVPAGTLIVLRNDTSAADTTVGSGDYNLDLGLKNTTYFAAVGTGTFDIATTEMVMIKAAGSGDTGVTGNIHTLAGGTAGTQFTNTTTGAKLRATGTSGTNIFVYANNTTEMLADFNGTDATGGATGLTFGAGNNAHNTAYINSLRTPPPMGEPTVPASNVNFTNVGATALTVNWTNGNGTARIVLAKAGAAVDAVPSDATTYTANAAFGNGSQIGAGNFVVFTGSGNNVTVTNLAPSTTYHFAVFEYNGTGASTDYLTSAFANGNQTTLASYTVSGHVQQLGGFSVSGVNITLTGDATPQQTTTDAAGNYSFSNVSAGGNYTITATVAGFDIAPANRVLNNLSGNQTADFTATPKVIISEFRFHGSDPDGAGALTGATNEFVELYNQTDATVDASGWAIVTSDNGATAKYTAPIGSLIPARGHLLVTGAGYGLAAAAASDGSLSADIPDGAGVALFNNSASFTTGTELDAVGFSGVANNTFRAGAGLAPTAGVSTDGEYSFARKLVSGVPQVTGDNAADFIFVATDGGNYDGLQAVLGAPSPENRNSPVQRNAQLKASLIDPQQASTAAPNRIRDFTPVTNGPSGTLVIRRKFTNKTGAPVTTLRFRIVDITTLGSPNSGPTQADLRALTSADVSVMLTDGSSVLVKGLTLDEPPTQSIGGGLHSTLSAGSITLAAPLAVNAAVNVQFVLGVQHAGSFRFLVNVEAPPPAIPVSTSEHLTMGNPSGAVTDENLPFNYLLDKPQYAVSYHRDRGIPNWVSWHLDPTWTNGTGTRQDDFRNDPSLPAGWYQVQSTDYSGSGFDRGHHCPSADRLRSNADNSATFFMTNMMPQAPDNNQGPWEVLESYSRTLVNAGNELYIIAGGVGQGGTGSNGGVTQTVANGHVVVPAFTWKVIIVLPQGTDDVSRVTTQTRTIAIIMPNTQGIRTNTWQQYIVSVDQVEALTGYDFFSNVPADIQAVIESRVDSGNAPVTALKQTTSKLQ
ncbi:MAG: DNA/RNA non-specific endonuclease [Pyrinomonadaceae bacterium]